MSTTIEIQTNEPSEKLRWAPIFTVSNARGRDAEQADAIRFVGKILCGFETGWPWLRMVSDGEVLEEWKSGDIA